MPVSRPISSQASVPSIYPSEISPISASPRRRLHLGHFAFMRAVVQGLDARSSLDRYLRLEGQYQDVRRVRHTIAWIRDEFAAAARR